MLRRVVLAALLALQVTVAYADDDVLLAANVVGPDPTARDTLSRAETNMDAGRYREALDTLDAGPVPAEAADFAAVRRAELALDLGDADRASAELAKPELRRTSN